jgi:nitronate monooxygenase
MVLRTAFTESLSVTHPIVSAPMGGTAGGALAAAVSNAGGLGLVGGGSGGREWVVRELTLISELAMKPWGVGFQSWAVDADVLARALEFQPAAVMLSFGDPHPFVDRIRTAGAKVILQVTDTEEARQAVDAGADVIVAQGSDAGGHSGQNAIGTMSFVPVVVDLVGPTPVLAAGGIADGRGLAAALALGAAGALIGTRFQASQEALVSAQVGKAMLDAHGSDTERNRVLDIARGSAWPARYPARTLRNGFLDAWRDREAELHGDAEARRWYREGAERGDLDVIPVWVGQAVDLITAIEPADALVVRLASEAESALGRAYRAMSDDR